MQNPILLKFFRTLIYAFIMAFLVYLYFLFSLKQIDIPKSVLFVDALISYIFLGIFNLGLWFFVRFNRNFQEKFYKIFIQHLYISVIYSLIYILISWLFVYFIIPEKNLFWNFMQNSFGIKILFGMIMYFLIVIFYSFIVSYQKNKENLAQSIELESMLQEEKLNSLKAQINPHFLFNSLNSISYLVYENADDAHEAIVKLSEYFRYSLTLSKNQFTKVDQEIDNVKRYFEIEKIRFPSKMNIIFDVEKKCEEYLIPVLILQPLAENSVKYGVYENIENAQIQISVTDSLNFYKVEFINNYDKSEIQKKGTSTGIENVKKRLRLIYKRNDLLIIEKTDNIFKVKINFPKKIENE